MPLGIALGAGEDDGLVLGWVVGALLLEGKADGSEDGLSDCDGPSVGLSDCFVETEGIPLGALLGAKDFEGRHEAFVEPDRDLLLEHSLLRRAF